MPSSDPLSTTDERLHRLMARGFQFIHPTDVAGAIQEVVGVRVHHGVVDVVQLRAEDDVLATRASGDDVNVLEPENILWQTTGHIADVLDALLALPDHGITASRPSLTGANLPDAGCGWDHASPNG